MSIAPSFSRVNSRARLPFQKTHWTVPPRCYTFTQEV